MLPDRVSNPGPLTYESGALPIALRGQVKNVVQNRYKKTCIKVNGYTFKGSNSTIFCFYTHILQAKSEDPDYPKVLKYWDT